MKENRKEIKEKENKKKKEPAEPGQHRPSRPSLSSLFSSSRVGQPMQGQQPSRVIRPFVRSIMFPKFVFETYPYSNAHIFI